MVQGILAQLLVLHYSRRSLGSTKPKNGCLTLSASVIQQLSNFASTEPQAAYSAYVFGLQSKWTFFCKTQPGLKPHLARLDDTITNVFVPALLGRPINAEERSIFTLPCRDGGLGMPHPSSRAAQCDSSRAITAPLTNRIAEQDLALGAAISDVRAAKLRTRISCNNAIRETALSFSTSADGKLQRVLALASERRASSWLTCRPMKRHGFTLTKSEFRDAVHLRYDWLPA